MFFRKNNRFRICGPTSPCWGQNRYILSLYFGCLTVFLVSEPIFWVSELIFWVSELISLVLGVWTYTLGVWTYIACVGCLNLYFGHQRTKHSEDPWIWKYWRTKHSGMTGESGNTEGQAFWYDLWIWEYWRTNKHSGMTCESGNTEGLEPVDFRPIWTMGLDRLGS